MSEFLDKLNSKLNEFLGNDIEYKDNVVFDCVDPKYIPMKSTSKSAAYDLVARLDDQVEILPGERKLIPTGLKLGLRPGTYADVRSRSGLALKYGIIVLNSPGTIDEDYTDEVGVILYNTDKFSFKVNDGDRIAQLLIVDKYYVVTDKDGNELNVIKNEVRDGGFGSTGI